MRVRVVSARTISPLLATLGIAGCCGTESQSPKSAAAWKAAARASPAKKIGVLDQADAQSIRGWAWDPKRPNEPVRVDVFDGDKRIATLEADQYREDLEAEGMGEGNHQFEMVPPTALADGSPHAIHAKFAETPHDLTSSPRTMISFGDEREETPSAPAPKQVRSEETPSRAAPVP